MLTTIEKVILLKSVEFFTGTPDSVLAQVAELIEEVSVAAGDVIIARGDAGDSMYVVAQGLLRVHVDDVTLAWIPVSYTHLRAHETVLDLVCRLLLETKK